MFMCNKFYPCTPTRYKIKKAGFTHPDPVPNICRPFFFVVVVNKIVLDFHFFNIPQNHLFLSNKRDQLFCESET